MITLEYQQIDFPLAQVFRIARGAKTKAEVIEVQLHAQGHIGRAESVPYRRYQESVESVINQLKYVASKLKEGIELENILVSMSPGAAQNAVDCAYWDLKAKLKTQSVETLVGLKPTQSCITAQTLSIDTPEKMAQAAKALNYPPLIKVKLDNQQIVEKMRAIHNAAPTSQFIVDANEGWSIDDLIGCADELASLNVVLIEQPLAVGKDNALINYEFPVALCADESCHTRKDLGYLKDRYQAINIKLDKTGGLSEALMLAREARAMGFEIMVGCMVGSSLAMAPAFLISQFAKYVDLDGPVLIASDREYGFDIIQGKMSQLNENLWGGISDKAYSTV